MLRTILNNEFNKLTGQELSDYEYTVLLDYLEYYYECDWDARDLRGAVANFIDECYDHNEPSDEYPDAPFTEYTIREWWNFPMAKTTTDGNKIITTYRGGSTWQYK